MRDLKWNKTGRKCVLKGAGRHEWKQIECVEENEEQTDRKCCWLFMCPTENSTCVSIYIWVNFNIARYRLDRTWGRFSSFQSQAGNSWKREEKRAGKALKFQNMPSCIMWWLVLLIKFSRKKIFCNWKQFSTPCRQQKATETPP